MLIGPHAHLNGAVVEDDVFIATGASAFPGARIGSGTEVRINAVVRVNTVVASCTLIPIGWVAVGDPAQLFSPDRHDDLWAVQRELDFTGTTFGLPRADATMERITSLYAERFGRHRADRNADDDEARPPGPAAPTAPRYPHDLCGRSSVG